MKVGISLRTFVETASRESKRTSQQAHRRTLHKRSTVETMAELVIVTQHLSRTQSVLDKSGVDEDGVLRWRFIRHAHARVLLEMLTELVGEFLLELVMAAVLDLVLRAITKVFETLRFANPVVASASYVLLGALSGRLVFSSFRITWCTRRTSMELIYWSALPLRV